MASPQARVEEIQSLLAKSGKFGPRKPPTQQGRYIEIDVWARVADMEEIGAVLATVGFEEMAGQLSPTHRLFIRHTDGGWDKVDAKLACGETRKAPFATRLKRRGLVVAILGADGAGKSTLIEALDGSQPFATKTAYLGWRRRASAGSPGRPSEAEDGPSPVRRLLGLLRWSVATAARLYSLSWQAFRGMVVLCDRHPIEVEAGHTRDWVRTVKRRVTRLLPRPDLILMLDATAEVLHARKGEHTPDALAEMTAGFKALAEREGGIVIDATKPSSWVTAKAETVLWNRLKRGR